MKLRKAETESSRGQVVCIRVHRTTCTDARGLNANFHSADVIKGRVAFYARSFRFRACSTLFGVRVINRGTRPVISTRLCHGSPRGIPKNRKGRLPGHVFFRVHAPSETVSRDGFLRREFRCFRYEHHFVLFNNVSVSHFISIVILAKCI